MSSRIPAINSLPDQGDSLTKCCIFCSGILVFRPIFAMFLLASIRINPLTYWYPYSILSCVFVRKLDENRSQNPRSRSPTGLSHPVAGPIAPTLLSVCFFLHSSIYATFLLIVLSNLTLSK